MAADGDNVVANLDALCTDIGAHGLQGLWRMQGNGPKVRPYRWQSASVQRIAGAARDRVDIPYPGKRRVAALRSPVSLQRAARCR